ncbi:MAG TPA: type II toxin-antitoxin system VapC family toxin, partial [Sphingomonadaceae bacterium]|nr:type II toxin-antitoxin system VapC family toxin [Sphingomonadaceae bacterium]
MAILKNEPEREAFLEALEQADQVFVSPGTIMEARIVCHRRGGKALVQQRDELLLATMAQVVPIENADLDIAYAAFARYSKGSGNSAGLNFGDLFSYALAKARGIPLL